MNKIFLFFFLFLMLFNTVSALELTKIELVDIDTMQVEKNETRQHTEYRTIESNNLINPFDSLNGSMINMIIMMVFVIVGFSIFSSVVGSLGGRNRRGGL